MQEQSLPLWSFEAGRHQHRAARCSAPSSRSVADGHAQLIEAKQASKRRRQQQQARESNISPPPTRFVCREPGQGCIGASCARLNPSSLRKTVVTTPFPRGGPGTGGRRRPGECMLVREASKGKERCGCPAGVGWTRGRVDLSQRSRNARNQSREGAADSSDPVVDAASRATLRNLRNDLHGRVSRVS